MTKFTDALDMLDEAKRMVALCFHAAQSPGMGECGTALGTGLNHVTMRLDEVENLIDDIRQEADGGRAAV